MSRFFFSYISMQLQGDQTRLNMFLTSMFLNMLLKQVYSPLQLHRQEAKRIKAFALPCVDQYVSEASAFKRRPGDHPWSPSGAQKFTRLEVFSILESLHDSAGGRPADALMLDYVRSVTGRAEENGRLDFPASTSTPLQRRSNSLR